MKTKNLIGIVVIAILSLSAVLNPYTHTYLDRLKAGAVYVSGEYKEELMDQIEKAAEKYDKPPQDAMIDRVWKALPGYNGVTVDVKSSYEKMIKDKKFDERKLVFKQITPNIHLFDLPPSPIFKGHPEKPMVSLLINVAWGEEYLPSMLATLKEQNVHATFFLEGRWVKKNADLAKLIADGGHELGNHSYSHPNMQVISTEKIKEEIKKTNDVIESTTGKKPFWFGPPSGAYRDETIKIAYDFNMRTVLWTVDTIDWQKPSPAVLLQRVKSKVHPGAMILMHPTEPTDKALNTLITDLKSKGLRIGTVSKLMDEERIIQIDENNTNKK